MSVEVPAGDVARIILQFCKENGLNKTFQTMQEEAHVYLNTVENIDALVEDVEGGQWDAVLRSLAGLQLTDDLVVDLFEQILLELVELRELDAARSVLRSASGFEILRKKDPERFVRLEKSISLAAVETEGDIFGASTSKQSRRNALAKAIEREVSTVAPSRLLSLFGQALKYQNNQGLLPPGTQFDLFRNLVPDLKVEPDEPCATLSSKIKFGSKQHAECAAFSPSDDMLVTGSSDGFIEVWDYMSGKYRLDLKYQADNDLMSHDGKIYCLAFSREGELLATGGDDKRLKVWRLRTGKVLRRFELAKPPTCVEFSRDGARLLAGFSDGVIRLLGLKSGKVLKEFHGHTAFVSDVHFTADGLSILSASGDGTIINWSVKTCAVTKTVRPPHVRSGTAVLQLQPVPDESERMLVCCRAPLLQFVTPPGVFSGKVEGEVDLVDCCLSARAEFVYSLAEDGVIRAYQLTNEEGPVKQITALSAGPIGLLHHPHKNVLAAFGTDGTVNIFRP